MPNLAQVGETTEAFSGLAEKGQGVFTDEAIELGFRVTEGYPEFIHQLGDAVWNRSGNPITALDLERCRPIYEAQLRTQFYQPRFERASESGREFLLAMARLGAGGHRGKQIADEMGTHPNVARLTEELQGKGLIYQIEPYGPYDFTIPHFDVYLRRLDKIRRADD